MYVCDEQAFPGSCRQSVECLYDNDNVMQCSGGRSMDVSRRLFEQISRASYASTRSVMR